MMSYISNVLMFTGSIIIEGVLLAVTDKTEKSSQLLSTHLAGDMGPELTQKLPEKDFSGLKKSTTL